jgi:hypothetical protein
MSVGFVARGHSESIVVLQEVGVVLRTTYCCGWTKSTFIDLEKIRAVIINEVGAKQRNTIVHDKERLKKCWHPQIFLDLSLLGIRSGPRVPCCHAARPCL